MQHRVRGAIVIVAAMTVPAFAQPAGKDAAGDEEIGEVADDKPAADPKAVAPAVATSAEQPLMITEGNRFDWAPFGFLRMQYIASQNDPNVAFVGRDDGFELQNARVGIRGTLWRKARFVFSIDGALDERERVNVPDGELRVGLRDAFVDIALAGDDAFVAPKSVMLVKAGFFQTWIEPETQMPDTEREFVDRPIESRGIRATEGFQAVGLTPGRSLGAALRLDPPFSNRAFAGTAGGAQPAEANAVGFELAVQNGAEELASNNDNDKPAISLAGLVRFANGGYIVAGGRYNPRTVGELPARRDENDLQASAGVRIVAGPVAIGAGVVAVNTKFATTGGSQNAFGAHGQIVARFGPEMRFGVGYRFGIFDPSSLIISDRVMEHTAGAFAGVPRLRMRVQLQFTHVIEQAERDLSNSRAQLAAEVAL